MRIQLFSDQKFSIIARPASANTRPRLRFSLEKYRSAVYAPLTPSEGFSPIRILGNIAIEDADHSGSYPKNLGQSLVIQINYLQSDLDSAVDQPLSLGFWDQNNANWVKFATPTLIPAPDTNRAGYATVTLTQTPWNGDPPVSWGK